MMVVVGIDAHKRTHTAVVVDEAGRELGSKTVRATLDRHLDLLRWAREFGDERKWGVETAGICRGTSSATCSLWAR